MTRARKATMDASGILLAPVVAGDPGQRVLISSAGPDPVPEVDGASPSRLFSPLFPLRAQKPVAERERKTRAAFRTLEQASRQRTKRALASEAEYPGQGGAPNQCCGHRAASLSRDDFHLCVGQRCRSVSDGGHACTHSTTI